MTVNTNSYWIGVIFTPLDWAIFASKKFGIYNDWINGSTVFDPTMGQGNLLESLIRIGVKEGLTIDEMPIHNLYGNELNHQLYNDALERFRKEFHIDMSSNFTNSDFFSLESREYNIIFGNPPWMNFTDLPAEYKVKLKPLFIEYDLVEDTKKMLLGGSRVDIAALVIQKSIADFLTENGHAYFFQPLSLLLNDGAHDSFRRYNVKGINFSLETVYDFNDIQVFEDVSTRHGLVHYKKNKKARFPIPFFGNHKNKWLEKRAAPILSNNGPLSVFNNDAPFPLFNFKPIQLDKDSTPRQGINTSGANSVFFFNAYQDIDEDTCMVNDTYLLPKKFVYPLLVAENFRESSLSPKKWVLLPYTQNGRPLEMKIILSHPTLWDYLQLKQTALKSRKGKMIQTWRDRGYWWALLGVGKYNFSKHKVVWEAYGRKTFEPTIFSGRWQVNQSLQAYTPLNSKKEAERIQTALKNPVIEHYLHSLKMDGTMNWAQPGKIRKLFDFTD
ncbi:SAM-dependent DNA methyltransferase [bacterium]|nr:SAM-dependent DNA methyltransferase [bacterium]